MLNKVVGISAEALLAAAACCANSEALEASCLAFASPSARRFCSRAFISGSLPAIAL